METENSNERKKHINNLSSVRNDFTTSDEMPCFIQSLGVVLRNNRDSQANTMQ